MKSSKRKSAAAQPTVEAEKPTEKPLVSVPATCTFRETAELKSTLLRWVDAADAVQLDVSALQRIDTAAVQVLCAFARDRQSRALAFCWVGEAEALNDASRLLGVSSLLGLPQQTQP